MGRLKQTKKQTDKPDHAIEGSGGEPKTLAFSSSSSPIPGSWANAPEI